MNDSNSHSFLTKELQQLINELIANHKQFEIPINQLEEVYFPDFLQNKLNGYIAFCENKLAPILHDASNSIGGGCNGLMIHFLMDIKTIVAGILRAVKNHYTGNLGKANNAFDEALSSVSFSTLTSVESLPAYSQEFYRSRHSAGRRFTRKDLFHNPFENRHLVATNRFSIPGLPALYLGTSIYVCWEEYNQYPLKDLYFSRYINQRDLRIVKIQRLFDFLENLIKNWLNDYDGLLLLIRYMMLFPISIACSFKTQHPAGTFKPEYIIPQLLLQYVSKHKEVDGIMFPSTKVKYSNLHLVPAYNFVFPVKSIKKFGFCQELEAAFHLTEPTSVELEALINHSSLLPLDRNSLTDISKTITLVEGVASSYPFTAFGNLERILQGRELAPLTHISN